MNPKTMNPLQTLLTAWAAGAVMSRNGDGLHVYAPKGAIPPELVEALRANKAELLALLPERAHSASTEKGDLA